MRGKTPEHVTFQLEESKKTITNELYVAAASCCFKFYGVDRSSSRFS
jgi:hypothetical protein